MYFKPGTDKGKIGLRSPDSPCLHKPNCFLDSSVFPYANIGEAGIGIIILGNYVHGKLAGALLVLEKGIMEIKERVNSVSW